MRLTSITIAGFKGAEPVTYDLGPLTFVTGQNGQGKSRIREGIDFALGRDVSGVSAQGKELRAALAGAELDVTLTVLLDDGETQTVRRVRRLEKGTFKKPVLYIGGVEADETKLSNLLGDVSAPAGASWLDLSEDKLLAELARLGARAREGRTSVLDAIRAVVAHNRGALADALCTALAVKAPPRFVPPDGATEDVIAAGCAARATDVLKAVDGCSLATLLIQARDVAKAEVNEAQKALKAIEGSADRSREASTAAEVRPDEVATKAALVEAAEKAFNTAQEEFTRAKAALESGAKPLADWRAQRARHEERVEAARRRLSALPIPVETTAPKAEVEPLRVALATAEAYLRDVGEERANAVGDEQSKLFAWGQAENTTRGAVAALKVLDAGHCPTCRQAITGDVRAVFDRALADAQSAEAARKSELDAAREYLAQQNDDYNFAVAECRKAREALDAMLKAQADDGRLAASRETYNAAAAELDRALHEQTVFLATPAPAEPADAQARVEVAKADAEREFAALNVQRAEHHDLLGKVERYKRWRQDLKARTDAEARKKSADALMETVRTAERSLAKAGADELLGVAAMYLPPSFGVPLVFEGAVGIQKGADFWSGPGLSSAQRLVLALSIDRALDTITGRRLRLALIEAEALDDSTLDHVCAALEGDVEMGELDSALLLSCHEPAMLTEQWRRIHVGPEMARGPRGGQPYPEGYGRPAIEAAVDVLLAPVNVPGVGRMRMIDVMSSQPVAGDNPFKVEVSESEDGTSHAQIEVRGDLAAAAGLRVEPSEPDLRTGMAGVPTPAVARALKWAQEVNAPPPDDEAKDLLRPEAMSDRTRAMFEPLSPEGAAVLAAIVEAEPPPPQAEIPLDGVAPKNPPPAPTLLPDPSVLSDAAALEVMAEIGIAGHGVSPDTARGILARRLEKDNPAFVIEKTAQAVRARLPKAPPKGVADWLWRPGMTLGDNPSRDTLDAVLNRLSARAANELRTWPGSDRRPFDGGESMDGEVVEELERARLVVEGGRPPKLTAAGVKLWEILHDVTQVSSDAQATRDAGSALAVLDGAGVTADEARALIKGLQADALKAMGEECCNLPRTANMTIGKRRDEIASRLAKAGTQAAALKDMAEKFAAAHPPKKQLTKDAGNGDGPSDETNEVGAAVAPEVE
jgi:hypothetical protein